MPGLINGFERLGHVSRFDPDLIRGRRAHFFMPMGAGSKPVGGKNVLAEHACLLAAGGLESSVVGFEESAVAGYRGLPVNVHVVPFDLTDGDICVWPEVFEAKTPYLIRSQNSKILHILYAQNQYFLIKWHAEVRDFHEAGYDYVACSSSTLQNFFKTYYPETTVTLVPIGLPKAVASPKLDRIVCMPRKRRTEEEFIRQLFIHSEAAAKQFEWVRVDNASHRESQDILATARIFLSLQRFEGFGLPALEAMSAGCLVVGFTGIGGRDYATPENGIWAAEDDIEGCVHALREAVRMLRDAPEEAARMISAGRETAARYSLERRNRALFDFFTRVLVETR